MQVSVEGREVAPVRVPAVCASPVVTAAGALGCAAFQQLQRCPGVDGQRQGVTQWPGIPQPPRDSCVVLGV